LASCHQTLAHSKQMERQFAFDAVYSWHATWRWLPVHSNTHCHTVPLRNPRTWRTSSRSGSLPSQTPSGLALRPQANSATCMDFSSRSDGRTRPHFAAVHPPPQPDSPTGLICIAACRPLQLGLKRVGLPARPFDFAEPSSRWGRDVRRTLIRGSSRAGVQRLRRAKPSCLTAPLFF
jgi:hypothetical protein